MNREKYLPIGSIILLKGGKKRLMITGFYVKDLQNNDDNNNIYDYCGCLYPEGVISVEKTAMFNHDQIDKIYYLGYSDEEEKNFKEKLTNAIANENN